MFLIKAAAVCGLLDGAVTSDYVALTVERLVSDKLER
jgi:hypothetical protein